MALFVEAWVGGWRNDVGDGLVWNGGDGERVTEFWSSWWMLVFLE